MDAAKQPPERARALAGRIAERLLARGETLAVAEATAGGLISHALTSIPGSSRWFRGSIVPYHRIAKVQLASVPSDLLDREGSVSGAVAQALADGLRRRLGATWGLGETGTAGPQTGRRSLKPAGETWIAVVGGAADPPVRLTRHVQGPDLGRVANAWTFALAALELLAEALG